ncbi:hypothetical protein [Noviherbaspirillum sp. UKPF54]|uniref:hypothetical protein n=1 Tax=Noviherbaspirillum sp. UKPF54 TaxID=2601898 RepID=UPI001FEEE21A|nr:hypothetical protein [Noviherbaspirillum sp. UKPF54]
MKNIALALGLAGLASLFAASTASAEVGVTADLGSTGIGAHISVPVQPKLNARFGINALNYNYSTNANNVDYDFKLKLQTFDALLDWFPGDTQFRISGGVVYNGNKIDAVGMPNAIGSYTINGNTYTAANAGVINGKIDFRKVAPYLGIGWGNALAKDKGWGFSADLGVLFQGSPNTTLTNTGCTAPAAQCDQLATDVAAEQSKLADKASSFNAYPVVRVGVSYKF